MFFDNHGLPISTRSALAADCYADGIDRYLSLNAGAAACFQRAIEEDRRFALAHAGLALAALAEGLPAPVVTDSIRRARRLATDLLPANASVRTVAAIGGERHAPSR
jgi:hypothetical protein